MVGSSEGECAVLNFDHSTILFTNKIITATLLRVSASSII